MYYYFFSMISFFFFCNGTHRGIDNKKEAYNDCQIIKCKSKNEYVILNKNCGNSLASVPSKSLNNNLKQTWYWNETKSYAVKSNPT